jgi:hypothetical protein
MAKKKELPTQIRPAFLEKISHAYNYRRKNIFILTGDIHGLFWSKVTANYVSLEQILQAEIKDKFLLLRVDIATGIGFFDEPSKQEITRICESTDGYYVPVNRISALQDLIQKSKHSPLSALVLLKGIAEAFGRVRRLEPDIKPLCVCFQFAGAYFPAGDFSRLSDLDRQCLISFLSWVTNPLFRDAPELLLLINSVKSEINEKIMGLPQVSPVEIDLPNDWERKSYVDFFKKTRGTVSFEAGEEKFAADTAGLSLNHINDLMEVAFRKKETITRQHIVSDVNKILQAQLGDIIRIKYPAHTSADIIGYQHTGKIIKTIFQRCEDIETAVAAIIVSGPNGSGKTFQLEAYAAESGRVVIELANIRGSYFGETDRFFELLRWHIATFGKILILVDEAHTAFGSVHDSGSHQTEMRLAGNIIKMMGDPHYLGKVLWGMMTSRPDELDPDIKSRAPIQIPIFDLEGDDRTKFLQEMFARKKIKVSDAELLQVMNLTDYYSARDYRNLVAEVLAQQKSNAKVSVIEVLSGWQASKSIKLQREFQEMIAAQHCSYPDLLPARYKTMSDSELAKKIELMKLSVLR